ncbi:MAG: AI-2E family transporter, partial [Desulfobacterales bacterium]|nr:AI-2E family transporter [Desulfobacterales bacterium]
MISDRQVEDSSLKKIAYVLGILGIIILGFYTLGLLSRPFVILFDLLTPFIMALILAYIISPIVTLVQKKLRLGRMAGTLLVFFAILLVFFAVAAVVLPVIITQLAALAGVLRTEIPKLLAAIAESRYFNVDPELIKTIETKLKNIELNYEQILSSLMPTAKKAATGGISTL